MGRDKKNEQQEEQFTKWIRAHRFLPAWKTLGFPAREIYFHLQIRCFAETAQKNRRVQNNNGQIFRSPRSLASDMGCNVKTAMSGLADLQAKGWVVCTSLGCLGTNGRGETARFRLTMLPMGKEQTFKLATQEPKHWTPGKDYPVLVYSSYKPKQKKGDARRLKNRNPAPVCGEALHHFMVHSDDNGNSSAPVCGAQNTKNRPAPEPVSGAYLIAMGMDKLRSNHSQGLGLCGLARDAAA